MNNVYSEFTKNDSPNKWNLFYYNNGIKFFRKTDNSFMANQFPKASNINNVLKFIHPFNKPYF